MVTTTSSTRKADLVIQELLETHSKYRDSSSIAFVASRVPGAQMTEDNTLAMEEDLSSMKILLHHLVSVRDTSDGKLKNLYKREMSLCEELAEKVPNIEEKDQFFYFTSIQQVRISYAIEAKRHRSIVNHDPTIADEYKVLLDKLPELADILKLPEAKALKDRFQTTSSDIQEPSQDSKDLEETLDSQDSDQFIEAIFGELDGIASEIKHHDELLECCFRLFQKVADFINVLESWIKQNGEATKKEREENIVRQKEDVTKKKSGGRAIRGPRGGGGSDSSNRLHVGNLSQNVDDQALEGLFSSQGKVLEARVVYDRDTGMSRGFGFVTYRSTKDRNYALTSLNGADLGGRKIRVSVAETRSRGF